MTRPAFLAWSIWITRVIHGAMGKSLTFLVGRKNMRTLIKVLFLTCVLGSWCRAQVRPLRIYWVDVEGGGATLIVTPAGESVLIDAGGYDVERDGARAYAVAAQAAGLRQIDYFIATHWHADHYGGAIKLSQLMPIKRFYGHGSLPANVPEDPKFPVLMPAYRKLTQGRSRILYPGDTLPLKQTADAPLMVLQCLASDGKMNRPKGVTSQANPVCRKEEGSRPDPTENAKSIVLKLQYGRFTFVDGGDLTWDKEAQLVCPINRVGTVDLFQIDHHGLDLSSNPVLLKSISPRVVVVNNGPEKGPEPNCVKTLRGLPSLETVWQLHRNVHTGPELNTDPQFVANNEVECKAQFIEALVQASGTFSVQIGQTGTRKEYRPR